MVLQLGASQIEDLYVIALSLNAGLIAAIDLTVLPVSTALTLCLMAVATDASLFQYVPAQFQTRSICIMALSRDPNAIYHIAVLSPETRFWYGKHLDKVQRSQDSIF